MLSVPGCLQLRNVALTSTADLMKNPEAHEAVSSSPEFLTVVVQALKAAPPPHCDCSWSLQWSADGIALGHFVMHCTDPQQCT